MTLLRWYGSPVAVVALAVCGCSFGVFSDLGDKAPAARITQDNSGISSSNFGDHLVGLSRGGTSIGGLLAITGNGDSAFAVATVTGSAAVAHAETDDIKDQLNDPTRITAMAPAPSATAVDSAQGPFVYIGTISGAVGQVRVLDVSTVRKVTTYPAPIAPVQVVDFGLALARAKLGGGGDREDLVVGAKNAVVLMMRGAKWPYMLEDAEGHNTAAIVSNDGGDFSVVVTGDLDGSTTEQEVVAAAPAKNRVLLIHHVKDCFVDTTVTCQSVIQLPAPTGASNFGAALLIADVDSDKKPELVVGAPDVDKVYIYDLDSSHFDLTSPASLPTPTTLTASGADDFGAALAFGKVDDGAKPLLVVGAPGTEVSGSSTAGALYLFDSGLKQVGEAVELAQPESKTQLGRRLAIVPYRKAGLSDPLDVLAASGREAVFVFFANLTSSHKDIR